MTPQRRNQLFIGAAIILIGAAMALSFANINIRGQSPWLIFSLFISAVWALIFGYEHYWQHGRVLDFCAIWVFFPLIIAIFVLFNLNWIYFSVIAIVLVGLSFIFGRQVIKSKNG